MKFKKGDLVRINPDWYYGRDLMPSIRKNGANHVYTVLYADSYSVELNDDAGSWTNSLDYLLPVDVGEDDNAEDVDLTEIL